MNSGGLAMASVSSHVEHMRRGWLTAIAADAGLTVAERESGVALAGSVSGHIPHAGTYWRSLNLRMNRPVKDPAVMHELRSLISAGYVSKARLPLGGYMLTMPEAEGCQR